MTSVVTPKSKQHHSFRGWSGTNSLVAPKPKPYHSGKSGRYLSVLLVLLNVVLGIAALHYVVQQTAFTDEVEHAHVLWALNQGIMPYQGIHQNHAPLLWMISAPLMAWLPKSAETMIALRGMSLLALVGIYFTGLLVLREILGPIDRIGALVMLLLTLAVLPDFESYRYRPDPLMALFAALAILAAVRLRRAPVLYSVISGVAFGLAASFSPKMAPLVPPGSNSLPVGVLPLADCTPLVVGRSQRRGICRRPSSDRGMALLSRTARLLLAGGRIGQPQLPRAQLALLQRRNTVKLGQQ